MPDSDPLAPRVAALEAGQSELRNRVATLESAAGPMSFSTPPEPAGLLTFLGGTAAGRHILQTLVSGAVTVAVAFATWLATK